MATDKSDLLQGTLDLLILKVVALRPIHGYAISQRIREMSREMSREVLQVQQGSLYPAVHRLEEKRWLKAEWGAAESGREAKFYALTTAGRKQLEAEEASYERLTGAIRLVLRAAN